MSPEVSMHPQAVDALRLNPRTSEGLGVARQLSFIIEHTQVDEVTALQLINGYSPDAKLTLVMYEDRGFEVFSGEEELDLVMSLVSERIVEDADSGREVKIFTME